MSESAIPKQGPITRTTDDLRLRRFSKRVLREHAIEAVLIACAAVSVLTTFGILWVLLSESVRFLSEVSIVEFFTGTRWTPLFASKSFGVLPILNASLLIAAIALLVAVPFGLGSAIYLAEFAPRRARSVLKPTLEILAGVPTVVYGYFALLFLTPLLQRIIPDLQVFNALSAGIAMGIMIIPMVASLSEDAISSVPQHLRDAASAVGATDMEKVVGVTVPAALSGIVASFILAMSRAVGETMIVSIAAGNSPELVFSPLKGMQTMTAYIVQVSLGDTPRGTIEYYTIFAVGATLFGITLGLNVLSRIFVRRFREVYD
ncbi:phosphate ABC transporter permease subunit PstC [soil metagenome]